MAYCWEDGVGGIACAAFEIAAAEMAFGLEVADHRFDRGSRPQCAFNCAEHAAFLSGDEYAAWILRVMAAVSLVDIGPLDLAPGEVLGFGR